MYFKIGHFFFNTLYIGIGAITGEVGGLYSKYYIEYRVKISLKINLGCTQVYATIDLNKTNSNLGEGKSLQFCRGKAASVSTEKLCLNSTNNFSDNIFFLDVKVAWYCLVKKRFRYVLTDNT